MGSQSGGPDAVVIVQTRLKVLVYFLGCIAFVAAGFFFVLRLAEERPDQAVEIRLFGVASIVVFGVAAAGWLRCLFKPSQLALSPSGLRHAGVVRTRNWQWSEVSDFSSARGWIFLKSNANLAPILDWPSPSLHSAWPGRAEDLATRLNEAKAKWG